MLTDFKVTPCTQIYNLYLNFQVAQVEVVEDFSVDLDQRQVLLTPIKILLVETPKLHQLLELQG